MENKIKNYILFAILIVIISVIITSVLTNSFNEHYKNDSIMTIDVNYDHAFSRSIDDMVDMADYIVIGKYDKIEKTWNMRRNINDITKESENDYVEGRLYKFTITEVLKGNIRETKILVNHRYLEKLTYKVDSKEATVNVQDPLYIEPQIGGTYMLFLSKDNNFGNYYGATEPFMIKIENDKAVLQSNLINKEGDFVTTARASNGDNIQINVGGMKLEDTITGMTLDELKAVIK